MTKTVIASWKLVMLLLITWALLGGAQDVRYRYVDGSSGNDLGRANDCRDERVPCKTLTRAIEVAQEGEIIKVSGTLDAESEQKAKPEAKKNEPTLITVDKRVTIQGGTSPGSTQTIKISKWEIEIDRTSDVEIAIVKIAARGSKFTGFKFQIEGDNTIKQQPRNVTLVGILIKNAALVEIRNNDFSLMSKAPFGGTPLMRFIAIYLHEALQNIVGTATCSFDDIKKCGGNSITISTGGIITSGGEGIAIKVEKGRNNVAGYNFVTITRPDPDRKTLGIEVINSLQTTVLGNSIEGNVNNGIRVQGDENILVGNAICAKRDSSNPWRCDPAIKPPARTASDAPLQSGIHILASGSFSNGNKLSDNATSGFDIGIQLEGSFNNAILTGNITTKNRMGMKLQGGSFNSVQVSENRMNHNSEEGILWAVNQEGASNNVNDNEIQENGTDGISYVVAASNFLFQPISIARNKIIQYGKAGIRFERSFQSVVESNLIVGTAEGTRPQEQFGISLKGAQKARIGSNEILRNKIGILVVGGSEHELIENSLTESMTGISLQEANKSVLRRNNASDNECHGIELLQGENNQVLFNSVIGNAKKCAPSGSDPKQRLGGGLVLIDQSSAQISNNIIVNNYNGISIRDNSPQNTFSCNSIAANEENGIQIISAGDQAKGNQFFRNNIGRTPKTGFNEWFDGNEKFGLRNFMNNAAVNARYNWWGDVSGPLTEGNPQGKGDKILGPVDFIPWLEQPIDPERCP